MEEFILICAVVFIFILGYFIMRKLDCFLVQNDLQMKEREGLGGECMKRIQIKSG